MYYMSIYVLYEYICFVCKYMYYMSIDICVPIQYSLEEYLSFLQMDSTPLHQLVPLPVVVQVQLVPYSPSETNSV